MKIIGKAITLLYLVSALTACSGGFVSPLRTKPTDVMETVISIAGTETSQTQAAILTATSLPSAKIRSSNANTAVFMLIPTLTPASTATVETMATIQSKIDIVTSDSIIFLVGESRTGGNIYGFPPAPFWMFVAQPDEIATFHLKIGFQTTHSISNKLTPTPTVKPTTGWRIFFYRYRTDEIYTNQPVVEAHLATDFKIVEYTDPVLTQMGTSLTTDVKMQELQTKFGDCKVFTFHLVNEQGRIQSRGYFYISPHPLLIESGLLKSDTKEGLTIGYPYSVNENEMQFFHDGDFVIIHEPQSGFFRLTYDFNFYHASGVSGTSAMEKAANELTIRVFPYNVDGKYSVYDSHLAIGTLRGDTLGVDLPIDYLRENIAGNNTYYLQVVDGRGNIIKDENFVFVPYTP